MRARGKENVIPSNTKENCDKKTCFTEFINEIGTRVRLAGGEEAAAFKGPNRFKLY
jgi:hypothetical protein